MAEEQVLEMAIHCIGGGRGIDGRNDTRIGKQHWVG